MLFRLAQAVPVPSPRGVKSESLWVLGGEDQLHWLRAARTSGAAATIKKMVCDTSLNNLRRFEGSGSEGICEYLELGSPRLIDSEHCDCPT
jgi:hypothetical protein